MATLKEEQKTVCQRFGVQHAPPAPGSKLGIALHTLAQLPLNALRHPVSGDTCGWYVWAGEDLSHDAGFFQPLHVEHAIDHCPQLLPYLALPPGWRVQLAPGHEDVWYDAVLLDV